MIFSIRHLPDVIPIGVQTEQGVEPIGFDLRPWLDAYDGMKVSIWPTRPGETAAYPAADTELVGSILYWYPNATDTATAGSGTVELLGLTGDKRKLSGVCKTEIKATSLGSTQDPPEAAQPWVDEVIEAADRAEEQADRAQKIADGLIFAEISGAVRYDQAQTLTDEQKAQARQNIGAGTGDGTGAAVEIDASLTKAGAAADAKAVGDELTALSQEIAKLPTGGGGAAIIDVTALPETDIREDVFYRLLTGTFFYNATPQGAWTCRVVETLPIEGEPVTTDMVHVLLYYAVDTGSVSGYIPSALSGAVGVPAGWYPVEALAQAFNLAWGGIIWDESEDPNDGANRLLLKYAVFYFKQEWINLSDKVGWRNPDSSGAEVFNSLNNTASGDNSHAEGSHTTASGDNSHAEGSHTTASGDSSHAEGGSTIASGNFSHAEGNYTHAHGTAQHVQGMLNIIDETGKYAHIVGNGYHSPGNPDIRSNAHTLDWDGNAWFAGGIELTSPNGTRYRFTVSDDGTLTATAV